MVMLIIWAALATVAALILLYERTVYKKEIYQFTSQLEQWIDDIILGKNIKQPETEEDTLPNKLQGKMYRLHHLFYLKNEENSREKNAIKEIISDISHQTKTPIANMKIYLDILKEESLSDKGKKFLGNLETQTDKLNFLFQSMVKMSRMETGIIGIQRENSSLTETLGKAVAAIVPGAEEKNITLYVQCEEDIHVCHDTKWTEEAIFNILDNAVKYTDAGGKIEISVSTFDLYTKISIKDNGKGIAPERQAAIFNRFYREPEVHDKQGIGIGLYLARKIVKLQNGYIEVHSRPLRGSDFQIYLMNESSQ